MANTYKNSAVKLSTTNETTAYAGVSNGTSVVRSIYVSNTHGSTASTIDVYWNDSTDNEDYYIVKNVSVSSATAFQPLTEPLILEAGDSIRVKAGTANILEVTVSVLEVT